MISSIKKNDLIKGHGVRERERDGQSQERP